MKEEITQERENIEERRSSNSKAKRKGKGKHTRSKRQFSKKEEMANKIFEKDKSNDVSWYANNKEILTAAASFSYFNPVGSPLRLGSTNTNTRITFDTDNVPGVMALRYVPTPGMAGTIQDPVNVAADNIYSYVRYQNSGASNYDPTDLMLYLLAMDEIYSWWARAVRAYGTIRIYSQTNRYLPKVLLAAQGFDADDIIGREAEFRGKINAMAAQIQAFCVPATLPFFTRHFWMNSNIYTDNDVYKPQFYLYEAVTYRILDEFSDSNGGFLKAYPVPHASESQGMTIDEWYGIMKSMLSVVNNSEDVGIMSGDILKAFGRENLFNLTAIQEDYAVLPVYNEEVLMQIENFDSGIAFNPDATVKFNNIQSTFIRELDITQVEGGGQLHFAPRLPSFRPLELPHILNFHRNDVGPEHAMIATRMKAHYKQATFWDSDTNTPIWLLRTCGTELPIAPRIYVIDRNAEAGFKYYDMLYFEFNYPVGSGAEEIKLSSIANFDWHPNIWLGAETADPDDGHDNYEVYDWFMDMANYTVLGEQQLDQTHICAVLSEFKIPVLGSF